MTKKISFVANGSKRLLYLKKLYLRNRVLKKEKKDHVTIDVTKDHVTLIIFCWNENKPQKQTLIISFDIILFCKRLPCCLPFLISTRVDSTTPSTQTIYTEFSLIKMLCDIFHHAISEV